MFASFQRVQCLKALMLIAALAWLPASSSAQTCPFDNGGSDATNDGLVLTRYALGITGAPLTASTRYASLDPLQVKNNIECVGCALDMNGDGQIDTVDTTIIARHLAGFQGASLTARLALGVAPTASRPTTAAVVSFLASGCATGPAGAFLQGGNSFGATALLATNDAFDLRVASGGSKVSVEVSNGSGLRVTKIADASYPDAPATINGSYVNQAFGAMATVAGGGYAASDCYESVLNTLTRNCRNHVVGAGSTISGGTPTSLKPLIRSSQVPSAAVAPMKSMEIFGTVAGGTFNIAGIQSAVGGGLDNRAIGQGAAIPGGEGNRAGGLFSFAAGRFANAAHNGSFVWGDSSVAGTAASTAANQFVIRSSGGVHLNPATRLYFGMQTRQMINLCGISTTT